MPKLFEEASLGFNCTSLKVLEEWVNSTDTKKIETVALLLKETHQEFIFQHFEIIIKILDQAYILGDECYRKVTGYLSSNAAHGLRSRSIGCPAPEDVSLQEQALSVIKQFTVGSPAYKFYDSLARYAKTSIEEDLKRDEEFD
jgi:hypothetical protein